MRSDGTDMKQRLFIATFSENAIAEIRENRLNIEFDQLCISENLNKEHIEKTLSDMRQDWKDSGAPKAIVHGPYTELNPSSIDSRALKLTRDRYEEAYQVCRRLGVNRMVVHSGFIPHLYYRGWHKEKSVAFWKSYMIDKPENFQLLIENVFEDDPYLIKSITEEINDERVRICLDTGHVNVSSEKNYDVLYWIRELGELIGHMHIHNNYGEKDEHGSISAGNINMEKVIAFTDKYSGRDVSLTIESRTCHDSIRWMQEKFHFK